MKSQDKKVRYGCVYPRHEGNVFHLNPHRRHAVPPSSGDRLVVVGYTPGVLHNLKGPDREHLRSLGFPTPILDEEEGGAIHVRMMTVQPTHSKHEIEALKLTGSNQGGSQNR